MGILDATSNRRANARLHAVANGHGIDHDTLHDLALLAFGYPSMAHMGTDDFEALTAALQDAPDAPTYAAALLRFGHDDPSLVVPTLKDQRLPDGPARSLAEAMYAVAVHEWDERRLSWTNFYRHARAAHGVGDRDAFERATGKRLPASPEEARALLDALPTTPPPVQPALLDAPARPRQLAGIEN